MQIRLFSCFLFAALTSTAASNVPRFAYIASGGLAPTAITADSSGNTYLTGTVTGNVFTATSGAYQAHYAGGTCSGSPCANGFVIELNPAGSVVFATYLGGAGNAAPSAIAVDLQGDVYVAGQTDLNGGFPVTPGAAYTTGSGFIAKLNPSGAQLMFSTLIPGATIASIAVDAAGNVYFTGASNSAAAFPTSVTAYQTTPGTSMGATIAGKLKANGAALSYGTYLPGPSNGVGIAVDASGDAFIAGTVEGQTFPATLGEFDSSLSSLNNVYLIKLSPDGSSLIYADLLGAAQAASMKVAPTGDIYIGAIGAAPDFFATPAGFGLPPASAVAPDFLVHVKADGSAIVSSLYLPFALPLNGDGFGVDSAGYVYLAGNAPSSVMPSLGAFQSTFSGTSATVVAGITPGGQVAGVTYFGPGTANLQAVIAAESDGSVTVSGLTGSPSFLGVAPPIAVGTNVFFAANFFPFPTLENAASYVANTVVAGEIASIQGYGLGPAAGVSSTGSTNLSGVQVYFDGTPAPILYAQANQINVQAPWELAGHASTQVQVLSNGNNAGAMTLPVASAQPGIFAIANKDGSRNSQSNPAHLGDLISLYGTGGGAMVPAGTTGQAWPADPLSYFELTVVVKIGGETSQVTYPGSAPTLNSGVFQINVTLPVDLAAGPQPVIVSVGGVTGATTPVWIH